MRVKSALYIFLILFGFDSQAAGVEPAGDFTFLDAKIPPGFVPPDSDLEGGLWMKMEQFEKKLKSSPSRITGKGINDYLHSIVCRLASEYCADIRVYLTRVPNFNAMMAPNGVMIVWTGLLLRVHNEAQLAAILGHELGHYIRRHSLDRFKDAKMKTNIMQFLSIGLGAAMATGGLGSEAAYANDISQLLLISSFFAHSRASEREADKYGIQLMAKAGYDPFEAAQVWQNIIEEEENNKFKKQRPIPFFATHPNSKDRLETLGRYAGVLSEQRGLPGEKGQERYIQHMRPYWHDMLSDELNLNYLDKTEFLLSNLLANNVAPAMVHYYKGELHRLRKNEDDIHHAVHHYERAQLFDHHPAEVYRSLGLIQLKQKQHQQAYSNFHRYLELLPEATDKEMIRFYLSMEK